MDPLPNDLRFDSMSMPGAHDAGSTKDNRAGTRKCQEKGIKQLLELGIRYLDVRCVGFREKDKDHFRIYHAEMYMGLRFGPLLDQVTEFLQINPSETVIMKIKEEIKIQELLELQANKLAALKKTGRTIKKPLTIENIPIKKFEEIMSGYFNLKKYGQFFWTPTEENPSLGKIRGKIVILQKFAIDANNIPLPRYKFGLPWLAKAKVQDHFSLESIEEKKKID